MFAVRIEDIRSPVSCMDGARLRVSVWFRLRSGFLEKFIWPFTSTVPANGRMVFPPSDCCTFLQDELNIEIWAQRSGWRYC